MTLLEVTIHSKVALTASCNCRLSIAAICMLVSKLLEEKKKRYYLSVCLKRKQHSFGFFHLQLTRHSPNSMRFQVSSVKPAWQPIFKLSSVTTETCKLVSHLQQQHILKLQWGQQTRANHDYALWHKLLVFKYPSQSFSWFQNNSFYRNKTAESRKIPFRRHLVEEQLDVQHGRQEKLLHSTAFQLLLYFPGYKTVSV